MSATRKERTNEEKLALKGKLKNLAAISSAFIDSHIAIRKTEWKLFDKAGNLQMPKKDSTAEQKLNICVKLHQDFNKASSLDGDEAINAWIDLAYELHTIQKEQEINDYYTITRKILAFFRVINFELLLPLTAEAIRDAIINELKDDPRFIETQDALVKQKTTLDVNLQMETKSDGKKKINADLAEVSHKIHALADNKQNYLNYFETFIKSDDNRALNEKTYEEFAANVYAKKRKTTLTCDVLKKLGIDVIQEPEVANTSAVLQKLKTPERSEPVAIKPSSPVVAEKPAPVVEATSTPLSPAMFPALPAEKPHTTRSDTRAKARAEREARAAAEAEARAREEEKKREVQKKLDPNYYWDEEPRRTVKRY